MLSFAAPLLDRVTTPFHACAEATVKSVDEVLLLCDRLLITRVPCLSRLPAADHCSRDRANSRARACIARDRTDRRPPGSAAKRAARPLATSNGRPGLLWRRRRGHASRVDPGILLRPRVTLRVVFT